ncbi:hypothetical protein PHISP_02158 [Aspergillus sp. HF37]|nr:hypothetical protein PHISP_02158 [Aspergillus sp. HF37]
MTEQTGHIAVDTSPDDDFDTQSSASEQTSLRSSIADYVYENGRRYHAYHAGEYWGSNDEKSMEAMDILHHVYSLLLNGKLYLAPIPNDVKRALDLGTGTGAWALDFGDVHPTASVIGTDLSPIQPRFVPPNVKFEVDDFCDEWVYATTPFDFIHIRGLYGSVGDWPRLYAQALRHLAPGGYIEQVEASAVVGSDDGSAEGTKMKALGVLGEQAAARFGKSLSTVDEMREGLGRAGFVDVVQCSFKVPIGPWPADSGLKNIGRFQRLVWDESLEMWAMMLFTKALGWSRADVEVFLSDIRKELHNSNIHAYNQVRVCYGRKPTTEESQAKG